LISSVEQCPDCGAALPSNLPKGLCSRCALEGALKGESRPLVVGPASVATPTQTVSFDRSEASFVSVPAISRFGDYELLQEISRGGMGIIYKARQVSLDRIVAVKLLLLGQYASEEFIHRFRIEASAAASLQHPNIVAIHEVGVHQGHHYFAMDFVDGPDLAQIVREQPLPAKQAAGYLKTIAEAIHFAHTRRILHRDLKPSNVLIDSNDQPRVTDFGLAKHLGSDSDLTRTGQVLGSPSFMPPEQALGDRGKMGPASDVYSLGAILYHSLTGRPPFVGETINSTLQQVECDEAVPPRMLVPSVPADLETICLRCLQKTPSARFQTALELAEELGRFLRGEPIQSRPVSAPEKFWRWCCRRPAFASLGATILLLLLAVAIGASIAASRINHARRQAEQNLYAADMNLAFKALEAKNRGQVLRLLEAHRPKNKFARDLRGWEWRYLWRESKSSELFALPGTKHEMTSVAFSPDGKYLATGEGRGRITVWDLATTQALAHVQSKLTGAFLLEFSPDGHLLAACAWEGGLGLWDWNHPHLSVHVSPITNGTVTGVRLDEKTITAVTPDLLRQWDRTTGEEILRFPIVSFQPNWEAWAIFSPDGRTVASSSNNIVMLWDIETKAMIKQPLTTPEEVVNPISFSNDGRTLVAGGKSGMVFVWDVRSHQMITSFPAHRSVAEWGRFSPAGDLFVTVGYDQTIKLWNTKNWQELSELNGHLNVIFSAAFSRDGKQIASASADGTVRFWSGTPERRRENHKAVPADVSKWSLSPDAQSLCLIFRDQTYSVWDLKTWNESPRSPLGTTEVVAAALFPGAKEVALAEANGEVFVIATASGQRRSVSSHFGDSGVVALSCSADGSTLAGRARDNQIIAWDASSGNELSRFTSESTPLLRGLPISKDGRTVATAPGNGTIELWEVRTLRRQTLYVSDIEPATDVAFFSDGYRVATSDVDLTARVWDLRVPDHPQVTMHADLTGLMCVALSPDETRLAAGEDTTKPNRVKVWDVATGQELAGLIGHKSRINDVAFWPDSDAITSVSRDAVFVWRGASVNELKAADKGK
jgi:eukaryotic-like serine/threonine-protein kinase